MTDVLVVLGSVEYLHADVTSDQTLDAQPVEIGIGTTVEDVTWDAATWTGTAGLTRTARILMDGMLAVGTHNVFVRVTDTPEVPIIDAGRLKVVLR